MKCIYSSCSYQLLLFLLFIVALPSIGFAQPPCASNSAPGNTICDATPICNLDGYCGNTYGTYTSDSWPELETAFATCTDVGYDHGTIDNNSFLSFTAASNCVSFNVYVNNCDGYGTGGIQLMLFSAEYCDHGDVTCYDGSYEWKENGGPYTLSSCNLTPGETYYIMIDGYSGDVCDYTFEAVNGVGFGITTDIGTNTTICPNESVTVTASGANDYTWSGDTGLSTTTGSTVTVIPPSTPGTYNYSVEGAGSIPGGGIAGCPGIAEFDFSITVQDGETPQFDPIAPICSGENLTLPGTSINGIDGSWSPAIDNTTTTDYTFTPNNSNCTSDTTITVEVGTEITPSFTNIGPVCVGENFTLPTTSNNGIDGSWSPAIDNTITTTYTFTPNSGTGGGGCSVSTATMEVMVNMPPDLPEISTEPASCIDPSESTVVNYNPTGTYTFTPAGPAIDGNGVVTEMIEGMNYTLSVNNGSCTSEESTSFDLSGSEPIVVDFDSDINSGCSPLTIQFQNSSTGGTTYLWDFGEGTTSTDKEPEHIYTQEGCYDVRLIVFNGQSCIDTLMLQNKICVDPSPLADFNPETENITEDSSEVHFENTSIGGTSYQWGFGDGEGTSIEENPIYDYNADEPGQYKVILIAQNDKGCTDTTTGLITVLAAEMHYQFPNIFTPNGDVQNDNFKLINYNNVKEIEIIVLNRWGNIVFSSNDIDFKWNGNTKNTGADCDDGTYFYKAILTNLNNEEVKAHGFVQLSRNK